MSYHQNQSALGGSKKDITINIIERIRIHAQIGTSQTSTFRGPPATLVVCASCGCKVVATEQDTSNDVKTSDTGFKCPNCAQKFSVTKSTLETDIATKEEEIKVLQQVLDQLNDEVNRMKKLKDSDPICPACNRQWKTETADGIQENGFKCPDAACGKYNKVEKEEEIHY